MKYIAGHVAVDRPEAPLGGSLKRWHSDVLNAGYKESDATLRPATLADANLFSSHIRNDPLKRHMVALDIDVPAQLFPSTQPGHSHLYIEKPIPWDKYEMLLVVMASCGLLEEGYVRAAIRRQATYLRAPWVRKTKIRKRFEPEKKPGPSPTPGQELPGAGVLS